MQRRDLFKLAGLSAVALASGAVAVNADTNTSNKSLNSLRKKSSGKRVVVIGGGFGGLTIAKELRKKDKSIEVVVLEKRALFMACPGINGYIGGLKGADLDKITRDYFAPANRYGYDFIQTEVIDIDRSSKLVTTVDGAIDYNILVLSPGIAYDYSRQFPNWDKKKIDEISHKAPAALMPGSEHIALKRELEDMDDGDVVLIPPAKGRYRCPPAPYERASMIANYMKKEEIKGRVIVLDTRGGKFAKSKAFMESWKDIYKDRVLYKGFTEIVDIDIDKKIVTYKEFTDKDDTKGEVKKVSYQVCNFIPINKANPVIALSGIKTNKSGFAAMDGTSFRSKSDKNIFVIGDAVGHKIPPSGQTAIWGAKRAALEIVSQLGGASFDSSSGIPAKNANVCFSMVRGDPNEGIMVTHDFSVNPKTGNLKGKGHVPKPKDGDGKFRSANTGKLTDEWFSGVLRELFL